MNDWIKLNDYASIVCKSYKTVARWLERHSEMPRKIVKANTGWQRYVHTPSLLANNWITEADLARLTEKLDTPGNQLFASHIVRKHHAEYEPAERDFLAKACGPNWMSLKKSELVTLLARRVGKSPSWLWHDYSGEDRRERKPDLRDKLTHDQFVSIERNFNTM